MENPINNIQGLSADQVVAARLKHGTNTLDFKKENGWLNAVRGLAKEPMVILLLVAAVIYFISGQTGDALFLAAAIVLVSGISIFQDSRSRNALQMLKDFSQPKCSVIRNGRVEEINSSELVIGDSLMVAEGASITADGMIIQANDFSVNESILTGESLAVYKDASSADNLVFCGTSVASGLAIATVTEIGNQTRLGKIGQSLESIPDEKTPLELQINDFVKKMVVAGAVIFVIVWGINYVQSALFLNSLIKALTLAMSILPEEIPVAFTTFMALGAWRLMKIGVVVKQMKTVETLGSASIICTDKTGTITENRMSLAKVYTLSEDRISDAGGYLSGPEKDLVRLAMWASEPIPFDPMEIALHQAYSKNCFTDERPLYTMFHEYPLGGKPPMMTHVFEHKMKNRVIAAKGAPEAILAVSDLKEPEKEKIGQNLKILAAMGYRVLGVGEATLIGNNFPVTQQELRFTFKGLVSFYDPPKENIRFVLNKFYSAGIVVKIITGDNAETTAAIAQQIGFRGFEKCISGDELMSLSKPELEQKVEEVNIFTRMFPDAKLKIVNALKARHEIVAMTGDGVNDGPALKAAHIGIAMGKKGTEIAKQAASLILLQDDLSKMADAVAMGRRIYANLKKAIQYIISIHIPIILTVFVPLVSGWIYPNLFSPIHVIFFELIMGPTCSIIYENEPIEKNTMLQQPRPFSTTFFNRKELLTSVLQGLVITAGTLFIYTYAVNRGFNEAHTRTMVFTCIIAANVLLTLVNRSFYYSLFTTLNYKNNLVRLVICTSSFISMGLIYLPPLAAFFKFGRLSPLELSFSIGIGLLSVAWYELVKWSKRLRFSH